MGENLPNLVTLLETYALERDNIKIRFCAN
jgi:hypothetical protein